MNMTRPVVSIVRRRSGNESELRESCGNAADARSAAGEMTTPNKVRDAANHPTTVGPANVESIAISTKGCPAITSATAVIGAPSQKSSGIAFIMGALTAISKRRAAATPTSSIATLPAPCINIASTTPPPARKATAVPTTVVTLPTIPANVSRSIRSLLRR
jgi:hypothetical protein